MRSLILLGLLLSAYAVSAQTPAAQPASGAETGSVHACAPAQLSLPRSPRNPPQSRRRGRPRRRRAGMAITVTDSQGMTLPGVNVSRLGGTSDRNGETNASGQINFTAMQAGTYRLRFSGERLSPSSER